MATKKVSVKKSGSFFAGRKTYLGIAMMVLGMIGASQFISNSEVSTIIDSVLKIGGVIVAVYGRYVATK